MFSFKGLVMASMVITTTVSSSCTLWSTPKRVPAEPRDTVANSITAFPEKGSQIGKAKRGERIFSDRDHRFKELPSFLVGKSFLLGSMAGENRVVPVTEGTVFVVTPRSGEQGSQEETLLADGFDLIDHPSFLLFDEQNAKIGVFTKKIRYQRFRLPDIRYKGWAVAFFDTATLPSISVAAEVIWNPSATYDKNTRLWQGCPSIEKTGQRYWGAWFSGGTREPDQGNYGIVATSEDGKNWVDPAMVIIHPDTQVRVMDTQLWKDPQGRLWVLWVQNTGTKGFDGIWGTWAIRVDNPEAAAPSWTKPRRLCDGLTRCKPIVLSTGEWLLPSYDWINHQSAVYVSYDQGENWAMQGGPINPPVSNFYEHMCVELNNGNIWMLQRNIQGSLSTNKGKDWTPLDTLENFKAANSRLYVGRLRSGNLLLIYNADTSKRRNLTAFLSKDDGQTWPYKILLDARDDVSYPDVVQDEGGLIHVCYDRSRRGEKEILMATFTECDIERGAFVSPQAREKLLISKVENQGQ